MKRHSATYIILWAAALIPGLPFFNVFVPLTMSGRDVTRVTGIEVGEWDHTDTVGYLRITSVRPGSPAARQDILPGDVIVVPLPPLDFDASDERAGRFALYSKFENCLYPLIPTDVLILRGETSLKKTIRFETPSFAETLPLLLSPRFIGGLVLMMFSLFLIWLRPKEDVSQLFFYANLLAYLSLTIGPLDALIYPFDVLLLKTITGNGLMLWCAAVFFHMLLLFPKNILNDKRWPVPSLYVLVAAITGEYGFSHAMLKQVGLSYALVAYATLLLFAAGLILIVHAYRKLTMAQERKRIKWLLFGLIYGFTPALIFNMLPTFLQKGVSSDAATAGFSEYTFLFLTLIPFGMFVSIARYHIWDVDAVLKKSVAFTILSIALVILYVGVVSASSLIFGSSFAEVDNPGLILATIVLAALFNPIKNRIQTTLDNLFFRKAYDYKTNILEFARSATSTISLFELIDILTHRVVKLMNISRIAIYLADNDNEFYRLVDSKVTTDLPVPEEAVPQHLDIPLKISTRDRFVEWFQQRDLYDRAAPHAAHFKGSPALAAFLKEQFILGIPFRNKNRLIGWMMLGSKLSELEYDQDDKNLLMTFSNQFAVTMDNALAYRRIKELNENLERKIRERTAELEKILAELQQTQVQLIQTEKMASLGEMVAGLVHEINNPLSFIKGNLELFKHHFDHTADKTKLIEEFELTLKSSMNGVERIHQVLKELKNFSRLDESEIKEVDLHESIDSVLSVFLRQYESRLTVVKNYHAVGLVNCYSRELNQAVMEILVNAAEAIFRRSDAGTIRITTSNVKGATGHPGFQIRIDDDGIGIDETIREKIFNPFFTTKDVGKGAGLGLSVAYGVVQKHRGRLYFHSEKDAGTSFFIEIPANVERNEA